MAKQVILTSGTPTTIPAGGEMINSNFTELYDGAEVVAATAKTTPVDADVMPVQDSAASNAKKKVTWANIKATLAASIKLDDFATPDDNTDLDATTGRHGLLPKLGGGSSNFLRADGTWAAPDGSSLPSGTVGQILSHNGTAFVAARSIASGTITASDPLVYSQTFNNAAVDFIGKSNEFTNMASGAATVLERWRVGSTTVLSVEPSGALVNKNTTYNIPWFVGKTFRLFDDDQGSSGFGVGSLDGATWFNVNSLGARVRTDGFFGFAPFPNSTNPGSVIRYGGTDGSIQLGTDHATTAVAQTIKAYNVTTGTGADLILKGGTGSVASGNVRFGVHTAVGSELVTGYITIKDEGGTLRKLAVIS
jgi:hypothetical protein